MTKIWYKIVERDSESTKTLFHGVNRSRLLKKGEWLEAEEKMVRDGSCQTYYLSGWHILPSKQVATDYLKRFKNRLELLKIVPCEAKEIRPKAHSNAPVFLAKWIKLI